MKAKIKYVMKDTDRHGNVRLYFRRNGRKLRLRGPEQSQEFFEDYSLALKGELAKPKVNEAPSAILRGSFRELCVGYFESSDFHSLAKRGQKVRRAILERFCLNNNDGDKPYAEMEPRHLRIRRDAMQDRPAAANNMLKAVRQVFKYATKYHDYNANPAAVVEYLPENPDGFHAWTVEEIEQFEQYHPVGTVARLALALALYTAQRRADIVRLGPSLTKNVNGKDWLVFTQTKNQANKPIHIEIPIIAELAKIIAATKTGSETFLVTQQGKPFTSNGFGNKFRDWCDQAGLKHCAVHGLRKAAAARLAERECTEQEIMAITGHKTSKEITRYTRGARQRVRAESALPKMSDWPK